MIIQLFCCSCSKISISLRHSHWSDNPLYFGNTNPVTFITESSIIPARNPNVSILDSVFLSAKAMKVSTKLRGTSILLSVILLKSITGLSVDYISEKDISG